MWLFLDVLYNSVGYSNSNKKKQQQQQQKQANKEKDGEPIAVPFRTVISVRRFTENTSKLGKRWVGP